MCLVSLLAAAEQPDSDAQLPKRYPEIVGLFDVHEADAEARADLLLYVLRQMNAGNLPDETSRKRLAQEATDAIDEIKADPDLLKGKDRQKILGQLQSVQHALGGAPKPAAAQAGPRPAPHPVAKAHRLDAVADRAAAVAIIAKLAADVVVGPAKVADDFLKAPPDASAEDVQGARDDVAQITPDLSFLLVGLAAKGGGFGSFADQLVLVSPRDVQVALHELSLEGGAFFGHNETSNFTEVEQGLTLSELDSFSKPASADDRAKVEARVGLLSQDVAAGARAALAAQQVRRLGPCVFLTVGQPARLVLFDAAKAFRVVATLDVRPQP